MGAILNNKFAGLTACFRLRYICGIPIVASFATCLRRRGMVGWRLLLPGLALQPSLCSDQTEGHPGHAAEFLEAIRVWRG